MNQRRIHLGIYSKIYLGAGLFVALSIMGQNHAWAQGTSVLSFIMVNSTTMRLKS